MELIDCLPLHTINDTYTCKKDYYIRHFFFEDSIYNLKNKININYNLKKKRNINRYGNR